jgi:hypothetical protein
VSYELAHGILLPKYALVMHRCDNPACVRPSHLELGSYQENVDDMNAKNRAHYVVGSKVGSARLDEERVKELRQMHAGGSVSLRAIARHFGVDHKTASKIVRRETWRHVA